MLVTIMNAKERAEALRAVPDELNPIAGQLLERLQDTLLGQRITRIEYGDTWTKGVWLHITTLTGTKLRVALDFDEWVGGGIALNKTGPDS